MGGSNYEEQMNYLVPPSVFHFWKFSRPKFFVVHCISMYFAWFRSIFLRALKFPEINERGHNFWGEPILQNVWIIWFPLLYFNLKSSMDPNSASLIKFQSILHESGRLFSESGNFYKLKRGRTNQFCRISELFRPPFCISILKVF